MPLKVLGLDVSQKTGYAIVIDGKLLEHGLLRCDEMIPNSLLVPDYEYIRRAHDMSEKIHRLVCKHNPDMIYLEATNAGRFRQSQKQLEFLHCLILEKLRQCCRKAELVRYIDTSAWRSLIGLRLSVEDRKNNKLVRNHLKRGKVTPKHLAVRWANQRFNLSLKIKDNDIADAIGIAVAGYMNEQLCDQAKVMGPVEIEF